MLKAERAGKIASSYGLAFVVETWKSLKEFRKLNGFGIAGELGQLPDHVIGFRML